MPGGQFSPTTEATRESWRVRIRDAGDGTIRGAGVLLSGGEYVLTCAHVVGGQDTEVVVECVGVPQAGQVLARAVLGGYVPPLPDERGDVALLRLDRRLTNARGATLRRVALGWRREVHACGFPKGFDDGVYTYVSLAGHGFVGPGAEWLQLVPLSSNEQRIREGFSGAGVVDEETGDVLGIIVCVRNPSAPEPPVAWVIPVETVIAHIKEIGKWVTGDPPVSEEFAAGSVGVATGEAGRHIAEWLSQRDTGDCVRLIAGPQVAQLYQVVLMSTQEGRSASPDAAPGTVPALGSVDLALQVSGMTVEEVAERIISRAGIPPHPASGPVEQVRAGIPPMTLVLDGVDRAADPSALLDGLLLPMARVGHRLLLGFRDESSPALADARSWDVGTVAHRLQRLAERIAALGTAEASVMSLCQQVKPERPVSYLASQLRMALTALRDAAASEPDWVERKLDRCEQKTARAERRTAEDADRLTRSLTELDEVHGLLNAYQAKANGLGMAEDPTLAAMYRRAYGLISTSPADVPEARAAVRAYRAAVHRLYDDGDGRR